MDNVLLAWAALAAPCLWIGLFSPNLDPQASGWGFIALALFMAIYAAGAFVLTTWTRVDLRMIDYVAGCAVPNGLLLAAYFTDAYVWMDTSTQVVVGLAAWFAGAIAMSVAWSTFAVDEPRRYSLAIFSSTFVFLCTLSALACQTFAGGNLSAGISFTVLLTVFGFFFESSAYAHRVFDFRQQFTCLVWLVYVVWQQATGYCVNNGMLWVPLVLISVTVFLRWAFSVGELAINIAVRRGAAVSSELYERRDTIVYIMLLIAEFSMLVVDVQYSNNGLAFTIACAILYILVAVMQFSMSYYGRDGCIVGGLGAGASLSPLVPLRYVPAVATIVLAALIAVCIVWLQILPLPKNMPRRTLLYRLGFTLSSTVVLYTIWLWYVQVGHASTSVLQTVAYIVALVVYLVMFVRGFAQSFSVTRLACAAFAVSVVVALAMQVVGYLWSASFDVRGMILAIYFFAFIALIVLTLSYREYELRESSTRESDAEAQDGRRS